MGRRRTPRQLELPLERNWGGRRKGAGRRPKGERAGVPHDPRPELDGRTPLHVTLRMLPHVFNLRSRRSFRRIAHGLAAALFLPDFRVVAFSVQGNHVHLIVEAEDKGALGRAMRSICSRIARGLNQMMRAEGRVFEDRYHSRPLRSPTEVANALGYVIGNFASHARRRGEEVPERFRDPYVSTARANRHLVSDPQTWLLRAGWKRSGRARSLFTVRR